ncbi:uncharacterized protein LOC130757067 [Actinidia eriantha]|uniref:uncharacterized protein LOC130757067 n=1 Tax=Actinidia eriantha TaxID=165200 RepID=UPI0025828733|nr:uncharacterized protein LOC130757067 [Actinidia eriantha]
MGCGESKHDIATGNTITKTKGQKSKDGSSMQQQEEENDNDANSKEIGAQKENEKDENEDSKEGDEKEWHSSGDNVEAVISDGMSGKTVYYSPNNNKVNDASDDDERSNEGVEKKGSVEDTIEEMKKNGL